MRTLDLFSGIGGFALAAHWMGWKTAAFVEWDGFCQKVLKKNFPNTPIYGDISQFSYEREFENIGPVDLVCGGFPCQPFSTAGKRNGAADDRYLWPEMLRIIREVKPAFVVGENVAGLISMDGGLVLEQICSDLEGEGYAVQPFVIPALAVGAPHRRCRVWIIAADSCGQQDNRTIHRQRGDEECRRYALDNGEETAQQGRAAETNNFGGLCDTSANPEKAKRESPGRTWAGREGFTNVHAWGRGWHEVATEFCRVDDGIPGELDKLRNSDRTKRLKALGNAIVPQVAYEIFRALNEAYA